MNIDRISIVMPVDKSRLPHLLNTLKQYVEFGVDDKVEFIFVTRSLHGEDLGEYKDKINWLMVSYDFNGEEFNPALALNLGVSAAATNNILITCPEVKPLTNVIAQLRELERGNYLCKCYDELPGGQHVQLVSSEYRGTDPGLYFLEMFKLEDIQAINGWDLEFMKGYAWEDTDFGRRFIRAGFSYQIKDTIIGLHQWHERRPASVNGWGVNQWIFEQNNKNSVTVCKNGLREVDSYGK